MAVVAGVNVQLVESWSDAFERAGMLSPSMKCKFGDTDADGYVRGEGCGAVLIKLLGASRRDLPYALVRGSAVNQDGKSNGMTAPNPAMQEALLRTAYQGSGVSMDQVGSKNESSHPLLIAQPSDQNTPLLDHAMSPTLLRWNTWKRTAQVLSSVTPSSSRLLVT